MKTTKLKELVTATLKNDFVEEFCYVANERHCVGMSASYIRILFDRPPSGGRPLTRWWRHWKLCPKKNALTLIGGWIQLLGDNPYLKQTCEFWVATHHNHQLNGGFWNGKIHPTTFNVSVILLWQRSLNLKNSGPWHQIATSSKTYW